MNSEIFIKDDYIEIGQLIKKINLVNTGGQVKVFLKNNKVLINGKKPEGRSTKVQANSII
ncbi:UNVERIFIED_CONTAM: RNA-binding S4 domain-containing protein [Campylobacter lari]